MIQYQNKNRIYKFFQYFQINHVDNSGQCACIHAAVNGHLDTLVYLLQCDWIINEGQVTKVEAMQQSFIVAAAMGHKDVSNFKNLIMALWIRCLPRNLGIVG